MTWNESDAKTTWTSKEIDDWWSGIEENLIQGMVYRSTKQEVMAAYNVAPWLAPSMRGLTIYNTEHLKGTTTSSSKVNMLHVFLG